MPAPLVCSACGKHSQPSTRICACGAALPAQQEDALAEMWNRINEGQGMKMKKRYVLVSRLELSDILLQTILWVGLVIVTFGLALPFFGYYFIRLFINTTEIHEES